MMAAKTAARKLAKAKPAKSTKPAKPAKSSKAAKTIKPVQAKQDRPNPHGKARKVSPKPVVMKRDELPNTSNVKELVKLLTKQEFEFHPAQASAAFDNEAFDEFFMAEIEREVERDAYVVNDRFARWPCQCCDVVIPVPRRTEVFHGDYHLVHDDVMGLLVNGERWVPRAETPIEVVQPGRLRNPWTGKTLEGRDLGTTGVR